VRVQALGLVGAGWPVGEVARALGVHPVALRRWVWQAWHEWGTAMGLSQPDSPDLPGDRDEGQQGAGSDGANQDQGQRWP
jgi:transposase-like protein